MRHRLFGILCMLLVLGLTACSRGGSSSVPDTPPTDNDGQEIPFEPFLTTNTLENPERICEGVEMDLSQTARGYFGMRILSEKKIVIQVIYGELKYNYTVNIDGSETYLPFQFGDGEYRIRVMRNTVDNKYIELASQTVTVTLDNEFERFLRPNLIVSYTADSAVVAKAAELAAEASGELDLVKRVYSFVTKNISYDNAFAKTVQEGYIPDPDRTLSARKGICFDYSSLAAAMLRSQGIPTKVITGYVGKEALYHAWNCIYIRGTGWVTVELQVKTDDWYRLDTTMGTGGDLSDPSYVDRYVY